MGLANEVQVGRFSHLLERLLSMKGELATQQLAPELLPVLCLENDRPEWAALANERLCYGGGAQGAVAGEFAAVQLVNPPTGDTLMVLDRMIISPFSADSLSFGAINTLFSGGGVSLGNTAFRDGRLTQGVDTTRGIVASQTSVGFPMTGVMSINPVAANLLPIDMPFPYVMQPGRGIGVAVAAVNVALIVAFFWRERKLEASEASIGS
jgi:hypothetical protein